MENRNKRLAKMLVFASFILAIMFVAVALDVEDVWAEEIMDGVLGQSLVDEMDYQFKEPVLFSTMSPDTYEEFLDTAWTTKGLFTNSTYYHRSEFSDRQLLHGVDVSWWQGKGGRNSTVTAIDWKEAHKAGIDFVFVRVGSRDTSDGSIYEDTCADSHICEATKNDINVGLYFFSQALTEKEAREEAEYMLDLIDKYGWNVTMPIVIDREKGNNKRLYSGKLSRTKETDIDIAFAETIFQAGYQPMLYTGIFWTLNNLDTVRIKESGLKIWMARYNNQTDKSVTKYVTYDKIKNMEYEFWQYSCKGKLPGYKGNIDCDFWYMDTNVETTGLKMVENETDSIILRWKPVEDAVKYRLYRYDDRKNKYVVVGDVEKNEFEDTEVEAGADYQYKVQCAWRVGGKDYYGIHSKELYAFALPDKIDEPQIVDQTTNTITLAWDGVNGASGYRIYSYNEEEEIYEKIADVKSDTEFQVMDLISAKKYQFKVKAYKKVDGKNWWGKASNVVQGITYPKKVEGLALDIESDTITLSWNKVYRVSGYQIYRLNTVTGKYEKIATIEGNETYTYKDTQLVEGETYAYKVRAYKKCGEEKYYGVFSEAAKQE